MAYNLSAKVIVTFTSSGVTALRVSRNRPAVPILALTPHARAFRQMSVAWGVLPMLDQEIHNTDEMVEVANRGIHRSGLAALGDRYVITAGVPFGVRGTTNLIRVERVKS
jgi:pyruvate kinase